MRTMLQSPSFYALIDSKLHVFTHLAFTLRFHTPFLTCIFLNFFLFLANLFFRLFLFPLPITKNGPTLFRIGPFLSSRNISHLRNILHHHLCSFSTLFLDEYTIFRIFHLHTLQIIVFCFHVFTGIHFFYRS